MPINDGKTHDSGPDEQTIEDGNSAVHVPLKAMDYGTRDDISLHGSVESLLPPSTTTHDDTGDSQPLTWRRRLTFMVEMLQIVAVYLSFVLLGPFFSLQAAEKNLSSSQVGFLLALFSGVAALASIVIGQLLPKIGSKFAFVAGSILTGGGCILMGPQEKLHPGAEFFWLALITFAVWAIGHAAVNTSCTAMVSYDFPGNQALLFGILESFVGLAFIVGGPAGSLFSQIGGYPLPFYVCGGFVLLVAIISYLFIPSYDSANTKAQEKTSVLQLLRIPAVWPACLALTITYSIVGFIIVGLSVHLTKNFDVNDPNVGYFWVLSGVSKTISSTLIGSITNRLVKMNSAAARIVLIVGQLLGVVTFVCLGPSQILRLPQELAIVCIGLVVDGIAKSSVLVPVLIDLTITARWNGLPDNFTTKSVISGLFWGAFSLGLFVGPLLGGFLIDAFGWQGACNFGAASFLVMAAVLVIHLSWEYQCGKGRRDPFQLFTKPNPDEHNDDERTPMIVDRNRNYDLKGDS